MQTTKGFARRLAAGFMSIVMTLSLLPALSTPAEAAETSIASSYAASPGWVELPEYDTADVALDSLSIFLRYQKNDAEHNRAVEIDEELVGVLDSFFDDDTMYIRLKQNIKLTVDPQKLYRGLNQEAWETEKNYDGYDRKTLRWKTVDWSIDLPVYGKKVIDLNGHTISVSLQETAYWSGSKEVRRPLSEKQACALFDIQSGASLTIVDSQGSGKMASDHYISRNRYEYESFDLFHVESGGELILNAPGAEFECGRSKKEWAVDGYKNYEKTHYNGYYRRQANGTVVTVSGGGKLTVAGGTLRGRGFSYISKWGSSWEEHRYEYGQSSSNNPKEPVRCAAIIAKGDSTVRIIDGEIIGKGGADAMRISDNTDLTIESGVFDVNKIDKVALPYVEGEKDNDLTIGLGALGVIGDAMGVHNYMDGTNGKVGIPAGTINALKAKGNAVEVIQSDHDVSGDELDDANLNTDDTTKRVTIRPKTGSSTPDSRVSIAPTNGMYSWNPTAAASYKVDVSLNERYFTELAREYAETTYRDHSKAFGKNKQEYYLNWKFTLYDSNGKKKADLGEVRDGAEYTSKSFDLAELYSIEKWKKLDAGKYTVRCEVTEVWKGEHTYKSAWYTSMRVNIRESDYDLLTALEESGFAPDFEISNNRVRGGLDDVPVMSVILTDGTQRALRDAFEKAAAAGSIPSGADYGDITVQYQAWNYDPDGDEFDTYSDVVKLNEYTRLASRTTGAKVITATIGIPQYKASDDATIVGYDLISVDKNFLLLPQMERSDGEKFGYNKAVELSEGQSATIEPVAANSNLTDLAEKGTFSWQWYFCQGGHDMYAGTEDVYDSAYEKYSTGLSNGAIKMQSDGTYRLVASYQTNKDGSTKQTFVSTPVDVSSADESRVKAVLTASEDSITATQEDLMAAELTLTCTGAVEEIESVQFSMKGYPDGMYSRPVVKSKTGSSSYTISLVDFGSFEEAWEDDTIDPSGEYTFRVLVTCKVGGVYPTYKVYSNEVTVIVEKNAEGYALVANGQYLGAGQNASDLAEKQAIPLYLDSPSTTVTLGADYYPKNATYDARFEGKTNIYYLWSVVDGSSISLPNDESSRSSSTVTATIKKPGTTMIRLMKWAGSSSYVNATVWSDTWFKVCVPVTEVEFEQPDYQSWLDSNYKDIAPTVKAIATCGVFLGDAAFDFTNYAPVYRDNGTSSDTSKSVTANDKGDVVYKLHLADGQSYPLKQYSEDTYVADTTAVKLTIKSADGAVTKTADKWGAYYNVDRESCSLGNIEPSPNQACFKLAQDVFVKDKNAQYIDVVTITTTEPGVGDTINEKVTVYTDGGYQRYPQPVYGQYKAADVFSLSNVQVADTGNANLNRSIIMLYQSEVSKASSETAGAPYTDADGATAETEKTAGDDAILNGVYENGTYFHELQLVTNSNATADGTKYYFSPDCKIILNGHLLDFGDRTMYDNKDGYSYLSFSYFYDVGNVNTVSALNLTGIKPQQGDTPATSEDVTATGYALKGGTSNDAKVNLTKLIWFVDKDGDGEYDTGEEAQTVWKTTTNAEGKEEITGYNAEKSTLWWDGTFLPGVQYSVLVEIGTDDSATRLAENIEVNCDGTTIHLDGGKKSFVVTFNADNTIRTIHIATATEEAAANPANRDPLGVFSASNQGYKVSSLSVYQHKADSDSMSAEDKNISNFYEGGTDLEDEKLAQGKYWMVVTFEPKSGYSIASDVKVLVNGSDEGEYGYGKEQKKDIYVAARSSYVNAWRTFEVPATTSSGATVSGTVTSFGSATDDVIVQLIESGTSEAAYEANVTGNSAAYSIENVPAGTYTMKVMKKDHVTREYTVTVSDSDVTQDAKIHLLGDVNGDGKVNTTDYGKVLRHTKNTTLLTGYEFLCGDVDNNGKLNTTDYGKILRHAKNLKLLW